MNGRRVEELREEKGLSKQELAAAAGVSPSTLRSAVREKPVQVKTAKKVGGALEVDPRSIAQAHYEPDEAAFVNANVRGWLASMGEL